MRLAGRGLCDRVELPVAGHAFQWSRLPFGQLDPRADDEVAQSARHDHFSEGPACSATRAPMLDREAGGLAVDGLALS